MDDATGLRWIEELCHKSNLTIWCYGNEQSFYQLSPKAQLKVKTLIAKDLTALPAGMQFNCQFGEHLYPIQLECLGEFNAYNLLAVLATLLANQIEMSKALQLIQHLKPVDGRMEMINSQDTQHAMMVVDFAHTPDALEKALLALRPVAKARGGQLICVFGCGGNRDTAKRPMMGKIAAQLADRIIITSDNPRMEDPEEIIQQIIDGLPIDFEGKVDRVADRAFAILTSVKLSDSRDVVLVAGKGHEKTQEIAGNQFIFSDQDHIRLAIRGVA
jgi:UDP-N-acetylmuramoyl-L-alanyl-D-glutamate--2,6-diaminopimelate ligase